VVATLPVDEVHLRTFPLVANVYDNRAYGSDKHPLVGSCEISMHALVAGKAYQTPMKAMGSGVGGEYAPPNGLRRWGTLRILTGAERELILNSPRPEIDDNDEDEAGNGDEGTTSNTTNRFVLGRGVLDQPLEAGGPSGFEAPFTEYVFTRAEDGKADVGRMKARMRILHIDASKSGPERLLQSTLHNVRALTRRETKRKKFTVRVYVTQGSRFQPSGVDDITQKPNKPRPYLQVSLGEKNVVVGKTGSDSIVTLDEQDGAAAGYNVDFYK
jgi:hypothetical protein